MFLINSAGQMRLLPCQSCQADDRPDILVRPGLQLGQEAGVAGAEVQAHRGQRQAMVALAGLSDCGRVDNWEDLLSLLQEQPVECRLKLPAVESIS